MEWAKRQSNPNNKKVKCANLITDKQHSYPLGFEGCTVNGKICLYHYYGYDKKDCHCFKKAK